MAYEKFDWNAKELGLLTLTPGQCAWLTKKKIAVHKVYCPTGSGIAENKLNDTSDYAATFHVYLNESETRPESFKPALEYFDPDPDTRDVFKYVHKKDREVKDSTTYYDLSWSILRRILAFHATSPRASYQPPTRVIML